MSGPDGQPDAITQLEVDGMSCGGCVRSVRKALEKVPGVEVKDVQIGSALLQLHGATMADAVRAVEGAGFHVRPAHES